ncbi:hypothetical protein N7462_001558 [Penicillium macrosclerotiorum]|uniref:uncharacterized protein n=1 Tax=Penicillium macrosclerotiorum TaxID=303699 RepID=UPI00254680AE|nr:uncharacterized protein N7462_001558 [Penicillium macrosclerotiorum]KAJ5692135.1 hypothetical protein N7462_001558 [Penicillium macrosclerotiorum]
MPDLLEEETYWSLLNSTLKENYPGFLSHLSDQEGSFAEEGQLAVLEFKDAQVATAPVVRTLETSRALKRYLNQPPNDVKQRAFILEGLPRNFIQILGEDLKVPPDFFAAHWSCPIVGSLLNRTPRHYDVKNRFILRFPRLHRARIQARIGDEKSPFYSIEADGNRLLSRKTIFGDMNGPLESPEHLSFWSTEGATPRNSEVTLFFYAVSICGLPNKILQ